MSTGTGSDLLAAALQRAPALTVRSLRVRAVELPADPPVETAAGTLTTFPLALIDLQTEQGVTGRTYVATYTPEGLAGVVAALNALDIAGRPVATLSDDLRPRFFFTGTAGLMGYALGGLDMAAWDALARAAELPLATLLGGAPEPVPAYGSLTSRAGADAEARAAEGFPALKVKSTDPAVIARIKALGVDLMVDLNQQPIPDIERLDDAGLVWIEEPFPAADLAAYARFTAATATPVQAGESWWSPEEARRSVEAGATDLVMPDVARVGGVTGFLRVAAHGLPTSTHLYPEVSAHLLAAIPNGHYLEHLDKAGPILQEPVVAKDGTVMPGGPIEWDEAAVTRFSV
ncbi:enolase C-terminal domain-like protein [Candidatus Solirubrobacter pratensis]|uniref:enolase C-terminal domain-like protein n=1 Tax=Candidatus Solirubrobacter pratensis TaxID=1298857 RepID=UPI0003FB2DB1|nr:enolase C-terminal domain-like protein [Candidatus Solirubrobacter pratensis]